MGSKKQLWACPACPYTVRDDPSAGDDWGGEDVAVGPTCPECEEECEPIEDYDTHIAETLAEAGKMKMGVSDER